VYVVDEHQLFRSGLCGLLAEHGLDLVGEAADGESACARVPRMAPDVVVMSLELPGMSGIEAIRRLSTTAPRARVMAFAMTADDSSVLKAIGAGATGYLVKDAPVEEVVAAVRAVAAGGSPISPRAAGSLFERLRAEARARDGRSPLPAELTDREVEVLRLLVDGMSNREIADELYISPPTVKHHISSILTKLAVENRIQAAVRAVQAGIV
jgi:DNA-binding NarL/FixJ family response regulator